PLVLSGSGAGRVTNGSVLQSSPSLAPAMYSRGEHGQNGSIPFHQWSICVIRSRSAKLQTQLRDQVLFERGDPVKGGWPKNGGRLQQQQRASACRPCHIGWADPRKLRSMP